MKLQQLHEDAQALEEGILQRAIAAAAMVIGSMSPNTASHTSPPEAPAVTANAPKANPVTDAVAQIGKRQGANASRLAPDVVDIIAQRYKVDPKDVKHIVDTAVKYQKADFPRAEDLLGLIGVESSFNPNAVSALKKDPAVGLTQIRPGAWGLTPAALKTVEAQIKHSADILAQYYKRLGNDADAALHAYNVGIGNHRKSKTNPAKANPRYVPKVRAETDRYVKRTSDAKTGPAPTR